MIHHYKGNKFSCFKQLYCLEIFPVHSIGFYPLLIPQAACALHDPVLHSCSRLAFQRRPKVIAPNVFTDQSAMSVGKARDCTGERERRQQSASGDNIGSIRVH